MVLYPARPCFGIWMVPMFFISGSSLCKETTEPRVPSDLVEVIRRKKYGRYIDLSYRSGVFTSQIVTNISPNISCS